MKQTIFKVSKSLGNFLSSYIILVHLSLLTTMNLLKAKGILSIPDNFVSLLDKAEVFTDKYLFLVLVIATMFLLISILVSGVKKPIKVISIIVFVVYACTMKSIYDFILTLLTSKISNLDFVSSSLLSFISYIAVLVVLEVLKRVFRINSLGVKVEISHKKIDELIAKYIHEEDTFNLALCDNLIKKYGGNINE